VRWEIRWRDAGRGSPHRKKTFRSQRDAQKFATAIQRSKDLGQLASEVVGSEQTLEAFIVEWWQRYATSYLAPGTLATYRYVIDRWLVRYLGELRLRDLTREAVDGYVAAALKEGAGRPTDQPLARDLAGDHAPGGGVGSDLGEPGDGRPQA
jgi:hypothetical protein